ncbi:MAG: M15 family metallopeptidase [Pseudomonadales bacterium]
MSIVDWQVLTGQSRAPLIAVDEHAAHYLHQDVLPHWTQLATSAAEAGFDLQIASAWRGFERQQWIWNGKASGQRPVLDALGQPLDISVLSEDELLFAILRWSAIPGCSRHHWGTDLDVFDAAAVPTDYRVQLTTEECVGNGVLPTSTVGWMKNYRNRMRFFFVLIAGIMAALLQSVGICRASLSRIITNTYCMKRKCWTG